MFFWPKREFFDLPHKQRLEKIIETYMEPKFKELGFAWVKEEKMSEDLVELIEDQIGKKLKKYQQYHAQYFVRTQNDFQQKIIIEREQDGIELLFSTRWEIESKSYEKWIMETYNEDMGAFGMFGKDDNSDHRIKTRYRTGFAGFSFNLNQYSTKKIADLFWKETLNVRIPDLEQYSNWDNLIEFWKGIELPMVYQFFVDYSIMNRDYKEAGRILDLTEIAFEQRGEYANDDEDFTARKTKLKSLLKG